MLYNFVMRQKIIISPFEMQKALLKQEREKDPLLNIKIFSKEQLISNYYGSFLDGAIVELMIEEKINYDTAKTFLSILPFVCERTDNPKIIRLFEMKQKLIEKGMYRSNPYLNIAFQNRTIEINGYIENDYYLNKILSKICPSNEVRFIKNNKQSKSMILTTFDNIENEVHFVMNQIAGLIKNGTPVDDIKLFGVDDTYLYQVLKYAKMYHININKKPSKSLFLSQKAREFLNFYKNKKNVEAALNEIFLEQYLDDESALVKKIILENIDSRASFLVQYDIFKNVLKETKIPAIKYKEAIEIIKADNGKKNQEIFVLGFRQGVYPLSHQDSDFLLESEKLKSDCILVEKANEETLFSLTNFFDSSNNFHFSFSSRDLTTDFHLSFLVNHYDFKIVEGSNDLLDHSALAAKIEFVKMLDLDYKYDIYSDFLLPYAKRLKISYKTYDCSFKTFDAIGPDKTLMHSYTSLDTFIQCQFKYYLSYVLKIDDPSDNFNLKLGIMAHIIFERCLKDKDNFDFERTYRESYLYMKNKSSWTIQEDTLLITIKKHFKAACKNILDHDKYLNKPSYQIEKEVSFKLSDNSYLKGTIDKVIILDDKYIFLVDYKTGKQTFNNKLVKTYRSLQLPTYGLLIQNSPEYADKIIGGLYTNNVIDFSIRNPLDVQKHPYLKLNGVTIFDPDVIKTIEPNPEGENPLFIKAKLKIPTNLNSLGKYGFVTKSTLEEYIALTRDKYIECDEKIRDNEFTINPKRYYDTKNITSCTYCPFADICFSESKHVLNVSKDSDEEEEQDEVE